MKHAYMIMTAVIGLLLPQCALGSIARAAVIYNAEGDALFYGSCPMR